MLLIIGDVTHTGPVSRAFIEIRLDDEYAYVFPNFQI